MFTSSLHLQLNRCTFPLLYVWFSGVQRWFAVISDLSVDLHADLFINTWYKRTCAAGWRPHRSLTVSEVYRCCLVSVTLKWNRLQTLTTEGEPVPPSLGGLALDLIPRLWCRPAPHLTPTISSTWAAFSWPQGRGIRCQRSSKAGHRTATEVKSADTFLFVCEV